MNNSRQTLVGGRNQNDTAPAAVERKVVLSLREAPACKNNDETGALHRPTTPARGKGAPRAGVPPWAPPRPLCLNPLEVMASLAFTECTEGRSEPMGGNSVAGVATVTNGMSDAPPSRQLILERRC